MSDGPAIEVSNLAKRFGDVTMTFEKMFSTVP
jgi:hypothetical protein